MSLLKQKAKLALVGTSLAAGLLIAGGALAQEMTASDATAMAGDDAPVTLSWTSNGNIANMVVQVTYDDSQLTPVQSSPPNVDGCLDSLAEPHAANPFTTCTVVAPGSISVTLNDATAELITQDIGTILFTVDGGAAVGDIFPIGVNIMSAGDTSGGSASTADLIGTPGSVEVVDAPPIPPEELSELSVAPASVDFGMVDLGSMPETATITASNTGGVDSSLNISAANLTGDTEFTIVTDGCTGTDLAAGESCDVVVEFNAGSDGSYSASVDFTSDADTNPNASVAVTGEAGSAPDVSVTPAPGSINLGTGLQGTVLTSGGSFSNTGSAPGEVSCTVSGAEFSTVPSPIAGTIEPGGSLDFSVQCTLPADAEDGDTFGGALVCSGDIDATWELGCGVSEWEPLPVPTMQKWGLIVLTLMMLMVGGLSIRFFRG